MLICSQLYSLKCNMNSGPGGLFDMRERPERHLASVRPLNVELVDVLNVRGRGSPSAST
jgi:hypothetical protein